jgi:NAD(P)-dependent dehydrogenase (short-subunit alcohol dehydrogenase family)
MHNKIIVITGAGKGLGKALADLCIARGGQVIAADRNTADVTQEDQVNALMERTIEKYGKIDFWFNNAGVWLPRAPLEEIDVPKAQKLFQVNFFGTFFGMRAATRQMKKQGSGTIVNIISTTAFDGMTGTSGSMYVSSKYALRGLTNSVREELQDTNISVIGVYPGGFKTDLFNDAKPENFDEFMSVESVAEKIIANLEQEKPETQLVIKRPGQKQSHELENN